MASFEAKKGQGDWISMRMWIQVHSKEASSIQMPR